MNVSIIVPVYNVECYLHDCLNSILRQTYSHYEIICINDGSTDSSLSILESYKSKDPRVKVFDFDNGGLSAARNRGLGLATGDLIYFMDSDDLILEDCLEKTVNTFKENKDVDVVFFDANSFVDSECDKEAKDYNYCRNISVGKYSTKSFFEKSILDGKYVVSACCYVFKADRFQNMRFIEGILHEDNLFTTQLLIKEDRICYVLKDKLFNRRIRSGSITTSSKTLCHVNGYLFTFERLKKDLVNIDKTYENAACIYLLSLLMSASVDLTFVSNIRLMDAIRYRVRITRESAPLLLNDMKIINLLRIFTPFLWKLKKICL